LQKAVKSLQRWSFVAELPFSSGGWGLHSQTHALLFSFMNIALLRPFPAFNVFYLLRKVTEVTNSKCSALVSSARLRLFFISNSAVFVDGVQKYFSPGHKVS